MSLKSSNNHLNDHSEEQTETKISSTGEICDMKNENTIIKEENIIKLKIGDKSASDNSDNADLVTKNVEIISNLQSNVTEEPSLAMPESDDTKCDICSSADVENITNSLAEKVTIENVVPSIVPEVIKPRCDIRNTEVKKGKDTPPTPEKLVQTPNKLDILGSMSQSASMNNSVVILKQETDSLKNLFTYDSSSDDEAESNQNWKLRTIDKSESESDSDDSDSSEEDDDEDDDEIDSVPKKSNVKGKLKMNSVAEDFTLKIYAENNIHDLPPIRDVSNLDIDVEKEDFLHMGHIDAVIETLVTVEAIPGTPAYDLDTCLFVDEKTTKKPLGAIYDVIGPVASPLYCVRFECASDVVGLNLKKGIQVFCAPKSKYTKYVFVSELMKHKGSDASWVGDVELPPEIAAQMSDDECDSESQEPRKAYKRKHGSQERHRQFEEDMNRCNTLNSHAARLVDVHSPRHVPRISRYNDQVQRVLFTDIMEQNRLPAFDPTVPPPGFQPFPTRSQPITRPAMVWTRHRPVPARPPMRQWFSEHNQSFANSYTNDMGHGPGTSSHPH